MKEERNCKDCSYAICTMNRANCTQGWWAKSYALTSVVDNRIPILKTLPFKCGYYSPPDKPDVTDKGKLNRKKIMRIVEAVRDSRKSWSYDEPPFIKNAYWGEWE